MSEFISGCTLDSKPISMTIILSWKGWSSCWKSQSPHILRSLYRILIPEMCLLLGPFSPPHCLHSYMAGPSAASAACSDPTFPLWVPMIQPRCHPSVPKTCWLLFNKAFGFPVLLSGMFFWWLGPLLPYDFNSNVTSSEWPFQITPSKGYSPIHIFL